jgi:hypothetical protein
MNNIDLNKKNQISFKSKVLQQFQGEDYAKIALLISNEYEGFSRNGGIGTYYTSLSQKLAQAGWAVILIICQSDEKYGGKSHIRALKHIFSISEVDEILNLTQEHKFILNQAKEDYYFKYQSVGSWLYCQGFSSTFKDSKIYIEFPDVNGFGYDTIQAKKANLLGKNCLTNITIHGCFEWVFEANDSINKEDWFNKSCHREQVAYENVDLAFFPSFFLKNKVESYGWQTNHAHNRPYFVPIQPIKIYPNKKVESEIINLYGMTSPEERNFAKEYGEKLYTGQGEIVDLGCWLGSFTIPFVMGLQANKNIGLNDQYVHAYDIFIWEKWMDSCDCVIGSELEKKYQPGDNFVATFEKIISPWQNNIKVYPGDLNEMNWDSEKTIEFLLIDAMKSWQLCNSIINKFFPALKPNLSLIQHQDYVHYYCSWIHLIMYRFKEYFEPILYVPHGSVIFKYIKNIPVELLQKTYSFKDFSEEEINQAFAYSLSFMPSQAHANIIAAKIMLYFQTNQIENAQTELTRVKMTSIYQKNSDLSIVEKLLVSRLRNEK